MFNIIKVIIITNYENNKVSFKSDDLSLIVYSLNSIIMCRGQQIKKNSCKWLIKFQNGIYIEELKTIKVQVFI